MKFSRIDLIGQNGNDGLHYEPCQPCTRTEAADRSGQDGLPDSSPDSASEGRGKEGSGAEGTEQGSGSNAGSSDAGAQEEIRIVASWPSPKLSPNNPAHWRTKAPIKKRYRKEGFTLVKEAMGGKQFKGEGRIPVTIFFDPPTRAKYDADNRLASIKSLLDGVADGLGVDDRRFVITFALSDQVVKGGQVRIEIGNSI